MPELEWLAVNKKSKRKVNYRRTFFPKIPTYNNIMYYNSLVKLLLAVILIFIIFISYHFVTFNHHKVKIKTVTKYKDKIAENIVFLGDSITHRYDLDKYYSKHNVVNSGEEGNKTDDILDDMYNRVYKYNPSKVILLIGTNQLEEDDVDTIVNGISDIVDNIHKERKLTKIYVESIYPVNQDVQNTPAKNKSNEKIVEINSRIKELSKEKNYIYIDLYSKLLDGDNHLIYDYTTDGLHISETGYKFITKNLKNYVED